MENVSRPSWKEKLFGNVKAEGAFTGSYLAWIKSEFAQAKGNVAVWGIWAFGLGFQLALFLMGDINALSITTLAATMIGLLTTVFMMIKAPINGLFGLISAFGFIAVNWSAGHYASVLDQVVFILLIDLPLLLRWRTWHVEAGKVTKFLSVKGWAITIVAMLIAWYPTMLVLQKLHGNSPFWDAIVLIIGATASIYVFRGYGDSYYLWTASNIVNIALWVSALQDGYSQASLPMLVSMIMYMTTAIFGATHNWSRKSAKLAV